MTEVVAAPTCATRGMAMQPGADFAGRKRAALRDVA